jgi:hypothetical protein
MWRRFFEIKKEEEVENIEEIIQIFEEEIDIRQARPVAAPEVEEARMQFSKEYFRDLIRQPMLETPVEVVERPNLQVPVGDEFMYLAQ